MIRTLIVAPYPSTRSMVEAMLSDIPDVAVLGAVADSSELLEWLQLTRERADPEMGASEIGEQIDILVIEEPDAQDEQPLITLIDAHSIPCIWIGDQASVAISLASSSAPGFAVLRPDHEVEEFVSALKSVPSGLVLMDRILARNLLEVTTCPQHQPALPATSTSSSLASLSSVGTPSTSGESVAHGWREEIRVDHLTPREQQVLQLMAQGLANKQIGGRLKISLHTVKFHVAAILAKLEASSRTEAVALGARLGLVTL